MDIAAGLQAASTAYEIAKGLRTIDKAMDQVALKGQIVDLMDALVNTKAALVDAQEHASEQQREIDALRLAFEERSALTPGPDGYSFKADNAGNPNGYPACPSCLQKGRISVLVPDGHYTKAKCPSCLNPFAPVPSFNSEGERLAREQNAANQRAMDDFGASHPFRRGQVP